MRRYRRKNITLLVFAIFTFTLLSIVFRTFPLYDILYLPNINGGWYEDVFRSGTPMKIHFHSRLRPPGVVLETAGGIGNQLFQFACSYSLAKELGWTLFTYFVLSRDPSLRTFYPYNRDFALDHFNIPVDDVIDKTTVVKFLYRVSDQALLEGTFAAPPRAFLQQRDYCQSEAYWLHYADDIRRMAMPKWSSLNMLKLQSFVDKINSTESVAVHVRRGDVLREKNEGFFVPMSFHRKAIRRMIDALAARGKTPVFFVFSDDVSHTKERLQDFAKEFHFMYVSESGNTSIEDFYLMILCKHTIIPTSTFSWWAAYLNENPDKIVIASAFNPLFWRLWDEDGTETKKFYMRLHGTLYYPKGWNVIDPFSGEVAQW